MVSLATVRDALLISRYQNIIDDLEFALLYDESSSRPITLVLTLGLKSTHKSPHKKGFAIKQFG